MEISAEVSQKLKIELPYVPALPFQGIFPKDSRRYHAATCTPMLIAALSAHSRKWSQPRCLSADEWIMKMWHLYTTGFYWAIKKNGIVKSSGNASRWKAAHYMGWSRPRKTNASRPLSFEGGSAEFQDLWDCFGISVEVSTLERACEREAGKKL